VEFLVHLFLWIVNLHIHFMETPKRPNTYSHSTLGMLNILLALGFHSTWNQKAYASWVKVLETVEKMNPQNEIRPNEMFKRFEKAHNFCDDFFKFSLFRVTKVLTYLGFLLFLVFAALGLYAVKHPFSTAQTQLDLAAISVATHGARETLYRLDSISMQITRTERALLELEKRLNVLIPDSSFISHTTGVSPKK